MKHPFKTVSLFIVMLIFLSQASFTQDNASQQPVMVQDSSLNNLVLASMMIALAILMMLAAHLRSAPPKGRRVSSNDDPTDHDEVTPSGARRRLIAI